MDGQVKLLIQICPWKAVAVKTWWKWTPLLLHPQKAGKAFKVHLIHPAKFQNFHSVMYYIILSQEQQLMAKLQVTLNLLTNQLNIFFDVAMYKPWQSLKRMNIDGLRVIVGQKCKKIKCKRWQCVFAKDRGVSTPHWVDVLLEWGHVHHVNI